VKEARLHPAAEKEAAKAARWYEKQQAGLGREFRLELEAALHRLRSRPSRGANYKNTAYRFYKMERFPIILYYLDLPDCLWIAAAAHASRRPDYWRRRQP